MELINFTSDRSRINKAGELELEYAYTRNGQRVKIPSRIKVKANAWDPSKQIVYSAFDQINAPLVNEKILQARQLLTKLSDDLPEGKMVKKAYYAKLNDRSFNKDNGAIPFFRMFDEWKRRNRDQLEQASINAIDKAKNKLMQFKPNLSYQDITLDFLIDYKRYCFEGDPENKIKPMSNAGVREHIAHIRRIMRLADEVYKYPVPTDYKQNSFQQKVYDTPVIWLYWEEVQKLREYKPQTEMEELVLDTFIFRAYSGIRRSDLKRIKKPNLIKREGKYYVNFQIPKSAKPNVIRLNKTALALFMKYNAAPYCVQQTESRIIKKIAEKAELTREVESILYRGRDMFAEIKPLHKVIAGHMARRSFARRWYEQKPNTLLSLSRFIGHSKIDTTLRYIGVKPDEIDDLMIEIFD